MACVWRRRLSAPVTPSAGAAYCGERVVVMAWRDLVAWFRSRFSSPPAPAPTPPLTRPVNRPVQPAALVYGEPAGAEAYAHAGALVVANRNEQDPVFRRISEAGGSVLVYLDPVISSGGDPFGRYAQLLMGASEFGPAVPRWPGLPRASEWGFVMDFRPGSVLLAKLPRVLDRMARERPHMAGWFADDVGSRSWFPNINWRQMSDADRAAWRLGAIEICRVFREVCDRYQLIFLVNGTWSANDGGGYPNSSKFGCALADGGYIENHPVDNFWQAYVGPDSQWARESAVTRGVAFNWAATRSRADFLGLREMPGLAYVSHQPDYGRPPVPWGSFHPTGLPSRVTLPRGGAV